MLNIKDIANTIIQGDCLDVMKQMPDNCVDLTVTSPPYDNLRDYKGFVFDFDGIAQQLYRVTKQGGVVVWVVGDATIKGSETGTSFKQALFFKEIGFNLHDTMIYGKNGFSFPESKRYHQVFEYMFILSKGEPKTFNPIIDRPNVTKGKPLGGDYKRNSSGESIVRKGSESRGLRRAIGQRYNIWTYSAGQSQSSTDKIAFQHPAIFPEKLAKDHVVSWSNEGDVIFDCFSGSGTTAKMANLMNRNYIGIEISPEYCKIARKRVQEAKDSMGLFNQ
jgi:site-specific DNA-methyltransferase (adenine-specific)